MLCVTLLIFHVLTFSHNTLFIHMLFRHYFFIKSIVTRGIEHMTAFKNESLTKEIDPVNIFKHIYIKINTD